MPGLIGALLSLLLAVPAQDPPAGPKPHGEAESAALAEAARRLLNSEAPREQSWGAWLAAEHRLEALAPLLGEKLQAALKAEKPERRRVEALGDALIRNASVPPPAELRRLHESGFGTMALIFAAHAPEASHSLLLSMAGEDRESQDPWVGACNLLLRMKSASFALSCLERIQVEALVTLRVDRSGGSGGRRLTVTSADGVLQREEGWPPVVLYDVTLQAATGRILLAEGPQNVYYHRSVYHRDTGIGSTTSPRDRNAYRLECLRSLAVSSGIPREELSTLVLRPARSLIWKDREQLEQDLREFRGELRTPWQALCRALAQKELLPRDLPHERLPLIRLKIDDRRPEGQRTPLPPTDADPFQPR